MFLCYSCRCRCRETPNYKKYEWFFSFLLSKIWIWWVFLSHFDDLVSLEEESTDPEEDKARCCRRLLPAALAPPPLMPFKEGLLVDEEFVDDDEPPLWPLVFRLWFVFFCDRLLKIIRGFGGSFGTSYLKTFTIASRGIHWFEWRFLTVRPPRGSLKEKNYE